MLTHGSKETNMTKLVHKVNDRESGDIREERLAKP